MEMQRMEELTENIEIKRAEELTENIKIKRVVAEGLINYLYKIIEEDTHIRPCNETINAVSRLSDSIRDLLQD